MTSSSHLASSALCYLAAAAFTESPISIQGLAITAVGSLFPDIDTPTSSVGRPFFPMASWINQKIGHRTLTHSFLGLGIFSAIMLGAALMISHWSLTGLSVVSREPSAYSHQPSVIGQPETLCLASYPRLRLPHLRRYLKQNRRGSVLALQTALRFLLQRQVPHHRGRPRRLLVYDHLLDLESGHVSASARWLYRSLHRAFGDIYSVSMDFKQYGDKNRIWLDLEGVESISNQKVKGQFEILAAEDNAAVLIERNGVKQVVSRTEPLQIFPISTRISIGEEHQISTQQIDIPGRTLGELSRFPDASRVLLYGYVTPVNHTPLSVHEGRYNPISLRLEKIKLEHAEFADIREQNLEHVTIREGILIAKIYRPTGTIAPIVPVPPANQPIRHIELRFKPTDQVLLAEGDRIKAGQVIGREDISIQLAKLNADYLQDLERLKERHTEVRLQLAAAQRLLEETEPEIRGIQNQLRKLESQPLLAKEQLRLWHSMTLAIE